MKRLIFIVEGETEKVFVDGVLAPYLYSKGSFSQISCFKIKHSGGGLTNYSHLKTDILNCVYQANTVVTTLIDFYALPKDFPKYKDSADMISKIERLDFLENAIKDEIEESQGSEFVNLVPYIQLHEFEALVFSSENSFDIFKDVANIKEIQKILKNYPNPEDINNSLETSPSKRLKKIIPGYNKVNDGIMIIEDAGINNLIEKCHRFASWVNKLLNLQ